jgi:hypothetical protein
MKALAVSCAFCWFTSAACIVTQPALTNTDRKNLLIKE